MHVKLKKIESCLSYGSNWIFKLVNQIQFLFLEKKSSWLSVGRFDKQNPV